MAGSQTLEHPIHYCGVSRLIGRDESPERLPGSEGGAGGGILGVLEQPPDPRGVDSARADAVDPDAFGEVVSGHGQREGVHRPLMARTPPAIRAGRRACDPCPWSLTFLSHQSPHWPPSEYRWGL